MAIYPAIPAKQWAVTDQQLLSLIQLATLEPDTAGATWASSMWTQEEVVQYLNDVQREFLHRTGITRAISFLIGVSNTAKYNLPQTTIDITRAAWREGPSGTSYVELARVDKWELDQGTDNWTADSASAPANYALDYLPSQTIQVEPAPSDLGEMELTTTDIGATLTGAGVALSIPDDWSPYIAWGTLAKMLAKSGEANDPDRSAYAQSRFDEGIALAWLMVEGAT